jgi:hypothetical protein
MSEQPKQEWHIEVGRFGEHCTITCNGELVYASTAHLHMEPGQPTTLHLTFPTYGPEGLYSPRFQRNDEMTVEGQPNDTTIDIGGRRYRLVAMMEGEPLYGSPRDTRA